MHVSKESHFNMLKCSLDVAFIGFFVIEQSFKKEKQLHCQIILNLFKNNNKIIDCEQTRFLSTFLVRFEIKHWRFLRTVNRNPLLFYTVCLLLDILCNRCKKFTSKFCFLPREKFVRPLCYLEKMDAFTNFV